MMQICCEWCPVLAICVAKKSGECDEIYSELHGLANSRLGLSVPLSKYRKFLKMSVIWIKHNEYKVRFLK